MAGQYFWDIRALEAMDSVVALAVCDPIMHRGSLAGFSVDFQPGLCVLTLRWNQSRSSMITVEARLLPGGVECVDVTGPKGGKRLIDNGTFLSALILSGIYKPI